MAIPAQAGAAVRAGVRARAGASAGARGDRHGWRTAGIAAWVAGIAVFAALHAVHLKADFPNYSPWTFDWAKYTDEGWYGNAAVRAHLVGHWYLAGDFNPAVAVPVWPLAEWVLFCFTGVRVEAARALAVSVFFVNLALSYALLRARSREAGGSPQMGSRWAALVGVSLLVTSPFLYCFSRLAILEPLETAWVLAGLNVAVRLGQWRRPVWGAAGVGALAVLAGLTKTTAIFLLPALAWAMAAGLKHRRGVAIKCAGVAGAVFAGGYGLWLALIARAHLWTDYKYYFFVNNYPRPHEWWWPLQSLWWSTHGVLWADKNLAPLAGVMVVGAACAWCLSARRAYFPRSQNRDLGHPAGNAGPSTSFAGANSAQFDNARSGLVLSQVPKCEGPGAPSRLGSWARTMARDPVFGASVLGIAGMILFMTVQNHPQPRYFAPVAFFVVFLVVRGIEALVVAQASRARDGAVPARGGISKGWAGAVLAATLVAMGVNGARTIEYAAHPEYTFVTAAANLTHYIDTHPNGNRLLVSVSGDEITLLTHLPALCDDFGTMDLPEKLGAYRPGWFAAWNDFDPGTLEDLHTHFSVEQVAEFPALDDPDRNVLVLYKLHPLPNGEVREPHDPGEPDLTQPLAEDRIEMEMQ